MRPSRRRVPHVTDLNSMTDRELVHVRFFGQHQSYAVQLGDPLRAYELLKQRGVYRFDRSRGNWVHADRADRTAFAP